MTAESDRRPIAARNVRIVERIAAWLVAHQASPNGISILGAVAGLLAGAAFAAVPSVRIAWPLWIAGAALVQARLLCNLFDGMVAVARGIASPLGELYNEVPDRLSDSFILAGFGVAAHRPALGLAAALAAMGTAYVRAVGRAAGAPSDFRGPMAKQQRMFIVTVVGIFCAVAPGGTGIAVARGALWLIFALALLTAARRVLGTARALRRAAAP